MVTICFHFLSFRNNITICALLSPFVNFAVEELTFYNLKRTVEELCCEVFLAFNNIMFDKIGDISGYILNPKPKVSK